MQETTKSTQTFYPAMRFADAARAIAWLGDAFGFEEAACYRDDDGAIVHAELRFKNGLIMLGSGEALTGSVYVAGARIAREICETEYGSREYSAYDCEGHLWSFGTYQP